MRAGSHGVEWTQESSPAQDEDILARPDIGSAVLLTYDRNFGDLIFNRGLPSPVAILYTRLSRAEPEQIAARLPALLEAGIATGHMITVAKDGERPKPFPLGATNA